jgi:hypothetical protein
MKVLSFGRRCSSWEAVVCSEYESAGDLLPKGRSSLGECIVPEYGVLFWKVLDACGGPRCERLTSQKALLTWSILARS